MPSGPARSNLRFDFRLILLSAMRYAMGRNTYVPAVVSDYIKRHIRFLDDKFLALAADDIKVCFCKAVCNLR